MAKRNIIIRSRGYLSRLCLVLLILSCMSVAAEDRKATPALAPFQATYSIQISGVTVGELTRRLHFDDNARYTYKSESKTVGIAALFNTNKTTETASGVYTANQLYPERYDYQREKGKKTKHEHLRFDHRERVVHAVRKGVERTLPLQDRSLDQLSYQLQIMADLLREESDFSYRILTAKKTKDYAAIVEDSEKISTGAGEFTALRLTERGNAKKRTTFWCAKSLSYLPVKVQISDGDAITTIVLQSYRSAGA